MELSADRHRLMLGLFTVAVLWLGLLVGVSFLATPVKFFAPSLQLPVALDVGRHTFAVFNKVEWIPAVAIMLLLVGARTRLCVVATSVIVLVLIAETIWLLPALDQRIGLIIAGHQPPASSLHVFYIAIEIVKLIALLVLSAALARQLLRVPKQA